MSSGLPIVSADLLQSAILSPLLAKIESIVPSIGSSTLPLAVVESDAHLSSSSPAPPPLATTTPLPPSPSRSIDHIFESDIAAFDRYQALGLEEGAGRGENFSLFGEGGEARAEGRGEGLGGARVLKKKEAAEDDSAAVQDFSDLVVSDPGTTDDFRGLFVTDSGSDLLNPCEAQALLDYATVLWPEDTLLRKRSFHSLGVDDGGACLPLALLPPHLNPT